MQEPLRVGVIGLCHSGMHHLERLCLRGDAIVVAAHDPDESRAAAAAAFAKRIHSSAAAVYGDSEVEAVLIAAPACAHRELACGALRAGKHALVERPLAATRADADAILAAARETGGALVVLQPRRFDEDFRTGLAALRAGKLGELRRARLVVLGLERVAPGDPGECAESALLERAADYFDQLLEFVDAPAVRVFARINSCESPGRARGFTVFVDFDNGGEALLEVDLDHPAELRSGWTLTGTAGAYRRFRHYTIAADGEVIDVPLDPLPADRDRMYDEVIAHIRTGTPLSAPPERSREVVALFESAWQSASLGRPVEIGN